MLSSVGCTGCRRRSDLSYEGDRLDEVCFHDLRHFADTMAAQTGRRCGVDAASRSFQPSGSADLPACDRRTRSPDCGGLDALVADARSTPSATGGRAAETHVKFRRSHECFAHVGRTTGVGQGLRSSEYLTLKGMSRERATVPARAVSEQRQSDPRSQLGKENAGRINRVDPHLRSSMLILRRPKVTARADILPTRGR
jgi:hypothetical protein